MKDPIRDTISSMYRLVDSTSLGETLSNDTPLGLVSDCKSFVDECERTIDVLNSPSFLVPILRGE